MIMLILSLCPIVLTPVVLHLSYPPLYPLIPVQAQLPVPMDLTLLFCWFPRLQRGGNRSLFQRILSPTCVDKELSLSTFQFIAIAFR